MTNIRASHCAGTIYDRYGKLIQGPAVADLDYLGSREAPGQQPGVEQSAEKARPAAAGATTGGGASGTSEATGQSEGSTAATDK